MPEKIRSNGVVQGGLTLVELLVAITITFILMAIAVPAFSNMLHTSRLRAAADTLAADLRLVMSEATKRGEDALISFQQDNNGANWCYGLSISNPCNCRQANSCQIDGVERITNGQDFAGLIVDPTHSSYSFKPKRSTVTAGNILFTAANGAQLKVLISGYGRIRPCSPSGSGNISGYPVCP